MKRAPLIFITISLAVLFTILAIAGKRSIYSDKDSDLLTTPLLSEVFTGINEGRYPWQLFDNEVRKQAKAEADEKRELEEHLLALEEITPTPVPTAIPTITPEVKRTAAPTATPEPTPEFPVGRYEPLRESTYDEYINHISADIYGDMGVLRAATYDFKEVPIEYFDDALFIGDSRTVGLNKYTDLSEHAEFLCETSLTINKVFETDFKGKGYLTDYLTENNYAKIYLMVGINELGTGTTENFMEKYTGVIDTIHDMQPDAIIFIQAIMNVDKEKNDTDPIFNNTNILGRNHAIATLADNETFFYIDVNEVVCDEEGNLDSELTFDHLHLIGSADEIWKEFLMRHGV